MSEEPKASRRQRIRGLLSLPFFYNFLQNAIGVPRQREFIVRQFVRPQKGDRILDIGCGTADTLAHLQQFGVSYMGIEPNEAYVSYAKRRWGSKGPYQFQVASVGKDSALPLQAHDYDIVTAFGVMHHLPDEDVHGLLRFAARGLKPSGRLVTMDPCRLPDMNLVEKLMVKCDRGCYIRGVPDYEALTRSAFHSVSLTVRAMNRLPYRAVVFVCEAPIAGTAGPADSN